MFLYLHFIDFPQISIIFLIVCMFLSCHVRVLEWITLYSCLNVKELLAWRRCEIWSLSDCNWTRTHNHLVRKRTLNHLAKLVIFLNDWAVLWVLICISIWVYVLVMPRTHFTGNPHSIWLSVHLRTKWLWVRVQLQSF